MSKDFESWWESNNGRIDFKSSQPVKFADMLKGVCEVSFKAGMLAAAEIAESGFSLEELNQALDEDRPEYDLIAAKIRKAAEGEKDD